MLTLREVEKLAKKDPAYLRVLVRRIIELETQKEHALVAYSETQPTHLYRCQQMAGSLDHSVLSNDIDMDEEEQAFFEDRMDNIKFLLPGRPLHVEVKHETDT